MRTSLFRQEALDYRRATLVGSVLDARRLPGRLVTGFAAAAALALAALGSFGEYAPTVRVDGVLAAVDGVAAAAVGGTGPAAPASRRAIAPAGAVLEARLRVPGRAVGGLSVGDPVTLRFAGQPFQRRGGVEGRVAEIARMAAAAGGAGEGVYLVRVALKTQRVAAIAVPGHAGVELRSGLPLVADCRLGRRRLAAWLFEPPARAAAKG